MDSSSDNILDEVRPELTSLAAAFSAAGIKMGLAALAHAATNKTRKAAQQTKEDPTPTDASEDDAE